MTKEKMNEYTLRVTQANTSQLAVVIFDIILDYLEEGVLSYKQGDVDEFAQCIVKAQQFHQELMAMLSLDNAVAIDVLSIYLFVNKQLILSNIKKEPVNLEPCINIMKKLRASFKEISKKDTDSSLMKNTQQVYAGLTYGRGYLKESFDPLQQQTRGLKA